MIYPFSSFFFTFFSFFVYLLSNHFSVSGVLFLLLSCSLPVFFRLSYWFLIFLDDAFLSISMLILLTFPLFAFFLLFSCYPLFSYFLRAFSISCSFFVLNISIFFVVSIYPYHKSFYFIFVSLLYLMPFSSRFPLLVSSANYEFLLLLDVCIASCESCCHCTINSLLSFFNLPSFTTSLSYPLSYVDFLFLLFIYYVPSFFLTLHARLICFVLSFIPSFPILSFYVLLFFFTPFVVGLLFFRLALEGFLFLFLILFLDSSVLLFSFFSGRALEFLALLLDQVWQHSTTVGSNSTLWYNHQPFQPNCSCPRRLKKKKNCTTSNYFLLFRSLVLRFLAFGGLSWLHTLIFVSVSLIARFLFKGMSQFRCVCWSLFIYESTRFFPLT